MSIVSRFTSVIAVTAILIFALFSFSPVAHAADGNGLHSAKIKSASTSIKTPGLVVCKDWGKTACAANSPQKVLSPGEKSPWDDADGYYVRSGYKVKLPITGKYVTSPGWHKITGCDGCTHTLRYMKK